MKYNQLNQMKAKSLPAGKHGDGRGLMLVKNSKVSGKWIFRYPIKGTKKRREMGLGRWPDVTLSDAREKADEARALLRNGIDPIADRSSQQSQKHGTTVCEAIHGCFEARQAQLKNDGKAGRWMSALAAATQMSAMGADGDTICNRRNLKISRLVTSFYLPFANPDKQDRSVLNVRWAVPYDRGGDCLVVERL